VHRVTFRRKRPPRAVLGDPLRAYVWAYVLHGVGGFALIGYLPFSKMFHMLAAQITTFAARQRLSESGGAA